MTMYGWDLRSQDSTIKGSCDYKTEYGNRVGRREAQRTLNVSIPRLYLLIIYLLFNDLFNDLMTMLDLS